MFRFRKLTRVRIEAFLALHASDVRALDIGAGGSAYSKYFPNRITVDFDPARSPDIVADAHSLPFADGEFALVLCTEVLEHLTDPAKALSEIWRVLAPDGELLLTTRFIYPIHDAPNDYWRFTRYGLTQLFNDWRVAEIHPETDTMGTLAVLIQRIEFQGAFRGGIVTKGILALLAQLLTHFSWLLTKEYGDVKKSSPVPELLASGYYVRAIK